MYLNVAVNQIELNCYVHTSNFRYTTTRRQVIKHSKKKWSFRESNSGPLHSAQADRYPHKYKALPIELKDHHLGSSLLPPIICQSCIYGNIFQHHLVCRLNLKKKGGITKLYFFPVQYLHLLCDMNTRK